MPSLTSYTPFETLKLCQSIVQHGSDAAAFRDIAAALNASDLIRESATYDEKRFTAAALHCLYDELVRQESGDSPRLNGDVASSSSRKRKLSTSPQPNGDHNEELVHSLVEKLYARFREEAVKEIRRDEEDYVRLQEEIKEMEKQPQPSPNEVEPSQAPESSRPDAATQVVPTQGQPAPNQDGPPPAQPVQQIQRPLPQVHQPPEGYPPPSVTQNPQQHHASPVPYNHGPPPPSPRQPGFQQQPLPSQHGYPAGPQSHPQMMLYGPGMHQMPPPVDYGSRKGSSSTSTPARGSPVPPHQQQYTPYQQPYHQGPPQWPHPYPPTNAYPPHMYPNQQYYMQSPTARQHPHYQTPHQPPYQPYPQTAPVPYQPPQGWQPSPSHSPYAQAHSTSATPIANLQRMQIARVSGSSTPWKRRQLPPNTAPPHSPRRPERSISPVSDTEDVATPLPATSQNARTSRKEPTPKREVAQARRGRPPSVAASGRSQSVASRSSEAAGTEKPDLRKTADIKMEAPSTPLPVATSADPSSTAEQRSSGRRGRPRNNTTTSRPDISRSTTNNNKRKRSEPDSSTPPPTANRVTGHHNPLYPTDPSLVVASKNFAKTTQIMLNDITSHKLAGVFAKPLSERDAPGYKDLILRPQDLKSIKTAAGRGSRAAVAAIEALEDTEDADEAGVETAEPAEEKEGLRGNGVFLVKKTDELAPPRGIANSAQLELELMRVFANAIMFNPLPHTERGFGRNLRLRKRGGDVLSTERDGDGDDDAEEGERAGSTTGSEDSEEGEADTGIITDAREMFEDVYTQVKGWRELERERQRGDGFGGAGGAEGEKTRQESVASVAEDARAGASTPTAAAAAAKESTDEGRGTLRKRRKIAE